MRHFLCASIQGDDIGLATPITLWESHNVSPAVQDLNTYRAVNTGLLPSFPFEYPAHAVPCLCASVGAPEWFREDAFLLPVILPKKILGCWKYSW